MSNLFKNNITQSISRKKSAIIKNKILSNSNKNFDQLNYENKHKSEIKKLKFTPGLLVDLLKKTNKSIKSNSFFKKSNMNIPIQKTKSIFKYKNIPGIEKLHHLSKLYIDNLLTDEKTVTENSTFRYKNNFARNDIKSNNRYTDSNDVLIESNNNSKIKRLYVTNLNPNKKINKNINYNLNKTSSWDFRKLTRNTILSYSNDINYTCNKNCQISEKISLKPIVKSFLLDKKNFETNSNSILNLENNKLKTFTQSNNSTKTNNENDGIIKSEENKNNSDNNFYSVFNNIKKVKRSSQIDRLIFKIENPEECFEEFVDKEKPGDKYQAFRNQILRHRNKIDKMIIGVKLNHNKCEEAVKKNSLESLNRKYIVKTLYDI